MVRPSPSRGHALEHHRRTQRLGSPRAQERRRQGRSREPVTRRRGFNVERTCRAHTIRYKKLERPREGVWLYAPRITSGAAGALAATAAMGPDASVSRYARYVRSAPNSRRFRTRPAPRIWAISGSRHSLLALLPGGPLAAPRGGRNDHAVALVRSSIVFSCLLARPYAGRRATVRHRPKHCTETSHLQGSSPCRVSARAPSPTRPWHLPCGQWRRAPRRARHG